MEEKLKNTFGDLTMPEACAKQIESKLRNEAQKEKLYCGQPAKSTPGGWVRWIVVAAALALCVMAVRVLLQPNSMGNTAEPTETTESYADRGEDILEQSSEERIVSEEECEEHHQLHCEHTREREMEYHHYFIVDQGGRAYCRDQNVADAHAASAPKWICHKDGRLYFTGNGEKIDITDQISLEGPFIYIGTDPNGAKWAYAVGRITDGPYVDIGNSVGWFIFYWDADMNCWIRDSGTHWSNWMDCEWPWLTQAEAILAGTTDSDSGTVPMPSQSE